MHIDSAGSRKGNEGLQPATIGKVVRRSVSALSMNEPNQEPGFPPHQPPSSAPAFNVSGAGVRSRLTHYRDNTGELTDRSLEALLKWAESKGVTVPEYARIIPVEVDGTFRLRRNGEPVDAKYFEAKEVPDGEQIYWNGVNPLRSIFDRESGAVIIYISHEIMENDERFLHVLAHEVFELVELKAIFDNCGGSLPVARFYELTEPLATVRNLHWNAWEQADALVERLRGERA
jgi:hypothetical protein